MKNRDIEFLRKLKEDILSGNRCHQAEPAFWMVMEDDVVVGTETEGVPHSACLVVDGEKAESRDIPDIRERLMEAAEKVGPRAIRDDLRVRFSAASTVGDVIDAMLDDGVRELDDGIRIVWPILKDEISANSGAFLTYEDCRDHIAENDYHYSDSAHPYALTAWRNPRFERLWRIVVETDWDKEKGEE